MSEDSKEEKLVKSMADTAIRKKQLSDKVQGDLSKLNPQEREEYENLDLQMNKSYQQFKDAGHSADSMRTSLALLGSEVSTNPNTAEIGMNESLNYIAQEEYKDIADKIISRTGDKKITRLSDAITFDLETQKIQSKVPMIDINQEMQPRGSDLFRLDYNLAQKLYNLLSNNITATDEKYQSMLDTNDPNADKYLKIKIQEVLNKNIRKSGEEFKSPLDFSNISSEKLENPIPSIENREVNENIQRIIKDTGADQKIKILLQNFNNKMDSDHRIKSFSEYFKFNPASLMAGTKLKFNKNVSIPVKVRDDPNSTEYYETIREFNTNNTLQNLLPEQNKQEYNYFEQSLMDIGKQIAIEEKLISDYNPYSTEHRRVIGDIVNKYLLTIPAYQSGAVFNSPRVFIAGENRKNNPEILFNRQQLEAMGDIFNLQKQNDNMKMINQTMSMPNLTIPPMSSNYVDNKRVSIQSNNVTEILPEPNSFVSFKDTLLY